MVRIIKPKADFLIEACHQITNPASGVSTVIATKAYEIKKFYGKNYYAVGPWYDQAASTEFEEESVSQEFKALVEEMKNEKIDVRYGRWLVPGNIKTFLLDFSKLSIDIKKIKAFMESKYGIDYTTGFSPKTQKLLKKNNFEGYRLDKQILWGEAARRFLHKFISTKGLKGKYGVVQFHFSDPSFSFISDVAKSKLKVGTVVTSHSTILGKNIILNNENLYMQIRKNRKISKRREYKYGLFVEKHQLELLAARYADVLTSVSEITGKEMQFILGRKPDIITPNGLEMSSFPSLEERAVLHSNTKNKIYRFLNAYFSPYYPIYAKDSLLYFTSGRYELTTKGYSIFFEALGKLNKLLKQENYQNNIFVFLFIMIDDKESNKEVLENLSIYDAIEQEIEKEFPHMKNKIIDTLVHGHDIKHEATFDEDFLINIKKLMIKFTQRKNKLPPVCAFKGLKKNDLLLKTLYNCGLTNKKEDKVKVIFYPAPVSVADELLSMSYHNVVEGMHLGVFPSLYEPWGYTPLETAAHGVLSITTDVAGFGRFIQKNSNQRKKPGIFVLKAGGKKREEIIDELVKIMHWLTTLPRKERIEKKLEAYNLAKLADWEEFIKYYIQAHNLAVERCKVRHQTKKKQSKNI